MGNADSGLLTGGGWSVISLIFPNSLWRSPVMIIPWLIVLLSLGSVSAKNCKDQWNNKQFKVSGKKYTCEFKIAYSSDGEVNIAKSWADCSTNCGGTCKVTEKTVTSDCGSKISV